MPLRLNLDQHNVADYLFVGGALAAPYALGFAHVKEARQTMHGIILSSLAKDLVTRYRYSVAKLLPLGVHVALDLAVGAAIAGAPFALGYAEKLKPWQRVFHVAAGAGAFLIVALTHPRTEAQRKVELQQPGEAERVKSLTAVPDWERDELEALRAG